jgi:hypothetical protein
MADRNASFNPEIATAAPILAPSREEAIAQQDLSVSLAKQYSPEAIARRLSEVEAQASKFKQVRAEASDIEERSEALATAVIAGKRRAK